MSADALRQWADWIDNQSLPRPDGVDPSAMQELLEAVERLLAAFCAARALACREAIGSSPLSDELQTAGGAEYAARAAISKATGKAEP